jgi:serine/threonine-protein kinase HipA
VAPYFVLKDVEARKIAGDVARGVANWRRDAGRHGLSKAEIDRMASAFDHEDLEKATRR